MARYHERGSLILGVIAIILAILSVEEYREIILNSDLIWIVISVIFMVLLYMLFDNKLIYQTSLFFGIVEHEIKVQTMSRFPNQQNLPNVTSQDIENFKRLYLWEYLIFSMIIMYAGVLLILVFLLRKSYIATVLSLVLMISMPLIGAYRFIERAKNGFSVRIEPETYFEIGRESEFKITLQNNYKKGYVIGTMRVIFPKDADVRLLKNGRYCPLSDKEFSAKFKLEGITKRNSKNVRPIIFILEYTGPKERIDRIYIEIFAYRKYDGKLVPIEEYQPLVHIIPVYLVPPNSAEEGEYLEERPMDQVEYELEDV